MERIKKIYIPAQDSDLALLPCPFCGEDRIRYEQYETVAGDRWRVCCNGCTATIDPGWTMQRIDVANLWNHRAERSK
mgnify:CR=1 FL=1